MGCRQAGSGDDLRACRWATRSAASRADDVAGMRPGLSGGINRESLPQGDAPPSPHFLATDIRRCPLLAGKLERHRFWREHSSPYAGRQVASSSHPAVPSDRVSFKIGRILYGGLPSLLALSRLHERSSMTSRDVSRCSATRRRMVLAAKADLRLRCLSVSLARSVRYSPSRWRWTTSC